MSLKFTVIGIVVMIMLCIGGTEGIEPTIHHIVILEDTIQVCFDKGDAVLTGYKFYQLDIDTTGDDIDMTPFALTKPNAVQLAAAIICIDCKTAQCLTSDVKGSLEGKDLQLVLHIKKEEQDNTDPFQAAGITSTLPGSLPIDPLTDDIYIIGNADPRIIKIKENLTGKKLFLNGVDLEITCTGNPCYSKVDESKIIGKDFMICIQSQTTHIPVCSNSKEGTKVETEATSVDTITIDYDGSPAVASFQTLGSFSEAIIIDDQPTTCLISACPVTADLTVWLVDYTPATLQFQIKDITDRDLNVNELGVGNLEVQWKKKAFDYFYMSRITAALDRTGTTFHTANVDCSATDSSLCTAYFIEVEGGNHLITIQKLNNWNDKTPENDIWKKKGTSTKPRGPPYANGRDFQGIHVEPIITTVADKNIVLDVCFNYVTHTSSKNTAYEFLAVNSKGQWKKITGEEKKSESHACFSTIELPLADFSEHSKFLVVLRDTNNGKPLASGEVKLNLPDVKAIKPDEDNSSEGSTSTLAIVGAAIGGVACLMALVAAASFFVMKRKRNNDGLQYPLHHTNVEDVNAIHGLDNPNST